jgi:membrane-associated phospholipid phosphatase
MTRHARTHLFTTLVLALTLGFGSRFAGAATPDSTAAHVTPADVSLHPPVPHLLTRGDMLYLAGAVGGTTLAVVNDRWLTTEAIEAESNRTQQHVADAFQPLGNPTYILAGALTLYGVGRLMHRPQIARRAIRVGAAVAITGVTTLALKEALGRERPFESPDRSNTFKPFSGHSSFPSGHAATAFATAVAIDRETSAHWVPWIVYPAATLVGWSRVHDRQHWTSDVVAGAALGGWLAWKTERFLARRSLTVPAKSASPTSWLIVPREGTLELVLAKSF